MCLSCTIEEITGVDLSTDEGHDALAKLGRIPWPEVTDEMTEAAALIAALYANPAGGTGGPLHITTDDNNVADSHLASCRKNLDEWTGYDCTPGQELRAKVISAWILNLLEPLNTKQRSVAISLAHEDLAQAHGKIYMPSTEFPIREDIFDAEGKKVGWQWGFRSRKVETPS